MIYKYEDFKANLEKNDGKFVGIIEKNEIVDGKTVNIYFYVISYNELFDNDIRREMRGITFIDKDTYYLSLHKFFNVNQLEETQLHLIKDKKMIEITDKLDGSLINPIKINGKLYMKSKASIVSDQAKASNEFVHKNLVYKEWIEELMDKKFHPIFEWVAPNNQIVLKYTEEDLVLLQIRDNEGNYLNINDFDIPEEITIRDEYDLNKFDTLEKIHNYIKDKENLEGVVVRFEDGQFVKIKSEWYLEKHKYTYLSDKDYMFHILNDTIDDILQMETADYDRIKDYIQKVNSYIAWKVAYVIEYDYDYETVKDFALDNTGMMDFGLLITFFKNRDSEEIVEMIKRNMKIKYNGLQKATTFFHYDGYKNHME